MKNIRLVQEDCTCALVPTDAWRDGLYAVMYCDLHAAAPDLAAFVEEVAGGDCHQYDKHLNPEPCGSCKSCRARALLATIDGGAR